MRAITLAKYIVTKCTQEGKPVTNLELQKILFAIQKDYLKQDKVAFYDNFEAWQSGAIVPSVYFHFCGFGAMSIFMTYDDENIEDIIKDKDRIDKLINENRANFPWELMSDRNKNSWEKVYQNGKGDKHIITYGMILNG